MASLTIKARIAGLTEAMVGVILPPAPPALNPDGTMAAKQPEPPEPVDTFNLNLVATEGPAMHNQINLILTRDQKNGLEVGDEYTLTITPAK